MLMQELKLGALDVRNAWTRAEPARDKYRAVGGTPDYCRPYSKVLVSCPTVATTYTARAHFELFHVMHLSDQLALWI